MRNVNLLLICFILVAFTGCSRFARVSGSKYRDAPLETSLIGGSRLEAGPLTLEAGGGTRFDMGTEELVPILEAGGGLRGQGWSGLIIVTADAADIRRTCVIIFTVETDL